MNITVRVNQEMVEGKNLPLNFFNKYKNLAPSLEPTTIRVDTIYEIISVHS